MPPPESLRRVWQHSPLGFPWKAFQGRFHRNNAEQREKAGLTEGSNPSATWLSRQTTKRRIDMSTNDEKIIAVVGATGNQGGSVVRALQASGQFKVRALSRNPAQHRELAAEVVEADLNRPETLKAAYAWTYGVFLVTNFWEAGTDETKQATAAVRAAKDADVKHFIWSTLPNVEAISGGKFQVPHFTGKARADRMVQEAGFVNHTFVIAPFFYQNLVGVLAPQKQAGAFAHPDEAGHGEYLPLVGDFMSFNEIVDTLNRQGHKFSFKQVPKEVFAGFFPGAAEIAEMLSYFEAHTYLGSDSSGQIALANKIAGRQPTEFSTWARVNVP